MSCGTKGCECVAGLLPCFSPNSVGKHVCSGPPALRVNDFAGGLQAERLCIVVKLLPPPPTPCVYPDPAPTSPNDLFLCMLTRVSCVTRLTVCCVRRFIAGSLAAPTPTNALLPVRQAGTHARTHARKHARIHVQKEYTRAKIHAQRRIPTTHH